jgi:integrative and conjugative element protein (TIGR02256 family)
MKLLLPQKIIKRIKRELRGRTREIGGILVGEHVAADVFRIVDISVQRRGGTAAHFVRDPEHHKAFLADFFARTGNAYQKFNYIGEWHSHPRFEPLPSGPDFVTMFDLIEDPDVGVNFAVLIIARLHRWSVLELSATLFRPGIMPESANVEVEASDARQSLVQRIIQMFTGSKGV